ncbi:MAG: hypothetical protein OJJ54_10550 [Pseudonocardia sp.]|nr:hypothetical protein [Pseudonocardia sp.]
MTTVPSGSPADPWPISPLLSGLVDDTSLLQPRMVAPGIDAVVARYLSARDGSYGGLVGHLVCPASRLPALVTELARSAPARPVDLALVVDTGLGAVPKALSTVFSRSTLLTPRTVETAAPPDVDAVWLERVSEFVPEDVTAVVEPRRPLEGTAEETDAWLDAVRRVAEHGCVPKLRVGGPRISDVPTISDVERFVDVAVSAGRGFTAMGLRDVVRPSVETETDRGRHGVLNLLVAVARAIGSGEPERSVSEALHETDGPALAAELQRLPERGVEGVRGLFARCGVDPEPVPISALVALGLLD